jgi:hypothetical protein
MKEVETVYPPHEEISPDRRHPVRHRAAAHHAATWVQPADADRRHWWLLLPILLPLATPLYNLDEPRLFGMPFFYWFQLSLAALSTAVMTAVHLTTRRR